MSQPPPPEPGSSPTFQIPPGPGRRRQRLTDQQTRRRMLDTALAMVHASGLTVSLEHISFEDVIREAGVSRTATYRRWPYKDLFISDLLRELAEGTAPAMAVGERNALVAIRELLESRRDQLESPRGRLDVVTDLLRLAAASDFEAVLDSPEWRTYLALHATFLSLPDGQLREDVRASLARSERRFVGLVANAWAAWVPALGYRIRPGSGGSFELVATLASAAMRGLVLMTLSDEELRTRRVAVNLTGASGCADWPLTSVAIAAIASAFLEPDPEFVWDPERLSVLFSPSIKDVFEVDDL